MHQGGRALRLAPSSAQEPQCQRLRQQAEEQAENDVNSKRTRNMMKCASDYVHAKRAPNANEQISLNDKCIDPYIAR